MKRKEYKTAENEFSLLFNRSQVAHMRQASITILHVNHENHRRIIIASMRISVELLNLSNFKKNCIKFEFTKRIPVCLHENLLILKTMW